MAGETINTCIPARLDRLPWSRWHWLIVIGLGITWVLDGLEVTLAGTLGGVLKSALHMTDSQVGQSATFYLSGAVIGALGFGWATDRLGRKKLFTLTLLVYLLATAATALSWNFTSYSVFRFITGLGIGGEYAAINSAIDELIPARHRGRIDIVINGTFWLGAALGALITIPLLTRLPTGVGWRIAFALGVILGLAILLVRRNVPESPRWLFIHGRGHEAEALVDGIEAEVERDTGTRLGAAAHYLTIRQRHSIGFATIARTLVRRYPRRTVLGLVLFVGQAFLYNAVTFGYAQILQTFFGVPPGHTGYYYVAIAVGNLLGPLLLGRFFDTVGRKPMITGTYLTSGILLLGTAYLFHAGRLDAVTMTACWCAVLFVASAGASSAYLTVSEVFPMETRAMAIAFFYAVGTAAGGISGPLVFARLVGSGRVGDAVVAFVIGAALMIVAGVVEAFLGIRAERKGLESIAKPLTAEEAEQYGAGSARPATA